MCCRSRFSLVLFLWLLAAPAPAKETRLSLARCIELAVKASASLYSRRIEVQEARLNATVELAAFAPTLNGSVGYERSVSPVVERPPRDRAMARSLRYDWSLGGLIPLGTRYDLGFAAQTTWAAGLLRPEHSVGLRASVTQPLLRGFGWTVSRTRLEVARVGVQSSRQSLRQETISLLLQVVRAYWQLFTQQQDVQIAENALLMSTRQLAQARALMKLGKLSRRDLHETESFVADQRLGVLSAKQQAVGQQRSLLGLLYLPGAGAFDLSDRIVPSDQPQPSREARGLAALLKIARKKRPDLTIARQRLRSQRLELNLAQNTSLPRLDLETSVASTSLTGRSPADDLPERFDGSHLDSYGQALRFRWPTVMATLRMQWPLSSAIRRQQEIRQGLALKRQQREYLMLLAGAELDIRNTYRQIQLGWRRLQVQRRVLRLAKRAVKTAERKFQGGVGAGFSVLRTQETLTQALRTKVQIEVELAIAQAELAAQLGTLPERLGVRIGGCGWPSQ